MTGDRIRAAAMEVFADKGTQVSLREIAERVGITKPALYYHYASREDLVRSIVQPMVDDVEAALARAEASGERDPRALLGDYFDATFRHHDVTALIMRDPSVLTVVNLNTVVDSWRQRLTTLLLGPDPSLSQRIRATMAIGGLGDCTIAFADMPPQNLKAVVLDAAVETLGTAR